VKRTEFCESIRTLAEKEQQPDFPKLCSDAFPVIEQFVNELSNNNYPFGLDPVSDDGHNIVRILFCVILSRKLPEAPELPASTSSWFSYIDANKNKRPQLKNVDMTSWKKVKEAIAAIPPQAVAGQN
jgi:hypothetical protein